MSSFNYTAKVLPLSGKYYGTIIELTDEGGRKSEIKVWVDDPDYTLSDRELQRHGFVNQEQAYQDNFPCDCHYESKRGYWMASLIAQAVNSSPS